MNGRTSTLLAREAGRINGLIKKPLPHKTLKRRLKKLWNKRPWTERFKVRQELRALHSGAGTPSAQ